jgi:hypothetical protein
MPALGRVPTDFDEWQEAYQSTPDRDDPFTTVAERSTARRHFDSPIAGLTRTPAEQRATYSSAAGVYRLTGRPCGWFDPAKAITRLAQPCRSR